MNGFKYIYLALFCFTTVYAQVNPSIKITGNVSAESEVLLSRVMIINQRTSNGTFAGNDGKFAVTAGKNDTILVAATGFNKVKYCFKDSSAKNDFNLVIKLTRLSYKLREVEIFPIKTLNEVQKDIDKLGVKKTNTYKSYSSIESPITALYEAFSKFERNKRKVAEMENEDQKRDVLKDLFRIYVRHDIIKLDKDQFDDFITFCNLSDNFIRSATQYELVTYIQQKYKRFVKLNDYVR